MVEQATDTPGDAFIRLAGVAKAFDGNAVLTGVDLDVRRGSSLVLIGPSGCGKSLLLKCILGLQHPDAGRIEVDGRDTMRLRGEERERFVDRCGMLFQRSGLFDSMTVWENVAFRALRPGSPTPKKQARERAIETLAMVGLDADTGSLTPAELSGGMQKRVGIARAIYARPEILLLDEPTAGLDPIMSNVINELVMELVRDLGCTAISVDSDMAGAKVLGERIAMLYHGRIIWEGPAADVDASGNDHLDQFVHSRAEGPIEMPVAAP